MYFSRRPYNKSYTYKHKGLSRVKRISPRAPKLNPGNFNTFCVGCSNTPGQHEIKYASIFINNKKKILQSSKFSDLLLIRFSDFNENIQ